ncbi:MAG: hypothetical protein GY832_22205 [Chloroflexi bacterium]|nr:hypothetical protein [Chloroflexota bacterium]
MPQAERYNSRDLTYSQWHRAPSIGRFVGEEDARKLLMHDADGIVYYEHRYGDYEPVLLLEVACDVGQSNKNYMHLTALAKRANVPAMCVLYHISATANAKADPGYHDIDKFRVKRVWPKPDKDWVTLSPQQYAEKLVAARTYGVAQCTREEDADDQEPPAPPEPGDGLIHFPEVEDMRTSESLKDMLCEYRQRT